MWHVCGLLFTNPLGYKPLILVTVMFIIQQVVGVYITIYYAVTFFQVRARRSRGFSCDTAAISTRC